MTVPSTCLAAMANADPIYLIGITNAANTQQIRY